MHSDAASQCGGWWQGCGAAYVSISPYPRMSPSFAEVLSEAHALTASGW